ncbi:MAG: hypothetical protein JOZ54_25645 [Acidobacteria bacterium]|nr:hypothetical protein [Acidobacteriota bacterium]
MNVRTGSRRFGRAEARPYIVLGAYLLLALLVTPVYPHFPSPNEVARWLLAAALVEDHSVEVTRFVPIVGPRMEDLAEVDGRLYANKAPGSALLGLPAYLAMRPFVGPPSGHNLRMMLTAMRLIASTLPTLLLGLLFLRLAREQQVADDRVALVVFLLLFATPLFPCGLLLVSHAPGAMALFGAWCFLFQRERNAWMAGALLGIAVLSEYALVFPAAILVLAIAFQRDWRGLGKTVAAGLPFAIVLGAYQRAAFGGVLEFAFGKDTLPAFRTLGNSGMFGIGFPSLELGLKLILSPERGLIVFSPFLLLVAPAFVYARKRLEPAAWWSLLLVPIALLVLYAGYPNWHGGWNVGPRYLVPALPFLVAPMLFSAKLDLRIAAMLGGWSFLAVFLTSIVFPFPPNLFPFPWMSFSMPLLGSGLIAPNVFHFVARPLAIAVPLLLGAFVITFVLRKNVAYAFIGMLLAIVVGSLAPRLASQKLMALQRSYVAEVYFEQKGALTESTPGLERRKAVELALPPESWPF